MRKFLLPMVALLPLLAGGCVRTVASVVTAPVKVVSQTADWATTSQDEADRNAGRKARKEDEKRAKEERKAQRERDRERDRD
ncbi:MAG: hypothetical protein WC729_04310 [Sphingomonas sp.]|jgi:hypothetical protein|uniref:hypothetical protein n=1 Tax=Sphingomonas sp. TaxID=28214 RepID=UPI003568F048